MAADDITKTAAGDITDLVIEYDSETFAEDSSEEGAEGITEIGSQDNSSTAAEDSLEATAEGIFTDLIFEDCSEFGDNECALTCVLFFSFSLLVIMEVLTVTNTHGQKGLMTL